MRGKIKLKKPGAFGDAFINEYLQRGFGNLQKREMDILIFYLLMNDGALGKEINFYQLSRQLKLSEARVKNLYFEAQLRFGDYDEDQAVEDFIELVSKGLFESDKNNHVSFIIRDPMLRQYFEEWVAQYEGFSDSSFNKSIVKVSTGLLTKILCGLVKNTKKAEELRSMFMSTEDEFDLEETVSSYIKKFLIGKVEKGFEYGLETGVLILKQMLVSA